MHLVPRNLRDHAQGEGNQAKREGDDDEEDECEFEFRRTFLHGGLVDSVKTPEKREEGITLGSYSNREMTWCLQCLGHLPLL